MMNGIRLHYRTLFPEFAIVNCMGDKNSTDSLLFLFSDL